MSVQTRGNCHCMCVCCHTCPWNPANAQRCEIACISEPVVFTDIILSFCLCSIRLELYPIESIDLMIELWLRNAVCYAPWQERGDWGIQNHIARRTSRTHPSLLLNCDNGLMRWHAHIQLYLHYNTLSGCTNTCIDEWLQLILVDYQPFTLFGRIQSRICSKVNMNVKHTTLAKHIVTKAEELGLVVG